MRPSWPTTRLIRLSALVERDMSSATSLKVSATFPAMPVQPTGRRVRKSPCRKAIKAASTCSASNCALGPLPPLAPSLAGVIPRRMAGIGWAFFVDDAGEGKGSVSDLDLGEIDDGFNLETVSFFIM